MDLDHMILKVGSTNNSLSNGGRIIPPTIYLSFTDYLSFQIQLNPALTDPPGTEIRL